MNKILIDIPEEIETKRVRLFAPKAGSVLSVHASI